MVWNILVLVHKGTRGTRGIVLQDTLCKLVEAIIDTRLRASLQFHDVLHRFRTERGTSMATMELKLAQYVTKINHNPLLLLLIDLRKSYNTVHR